MMELKQMRMKRLLVTNQQSLILLAVFSNEREIGKIQGVMFIFGTIQLILTIFLLCSKEVKTNWLYGKTIPTSI